jgi:transposase
VSGRRDPIQREAWWQLAPPIGVLGAPTGLSKHSNISILLCHFISCHSFACSDHLIDIDESGIVLATSLRNFGHSPIGHRATVVAPPPRGVKYTLIMAISPVLGVVCALITKENTNATVFTRFIKDYLVTQIDPGIKHRELKQHFLCSLLFLLLPGYYLMMDNLSSHRTQIVTETIEQYSHVRLLRPAYSPDYAPIENAFSKVKAFLRAHRYGLTEENLPTLIAEAIQTITIDDCAGWFRNCGYHL